MTKKKKKEAPWPKEVLEEVGLYVSPMTGELMKFENNKHNLGMTPELALKKYLNKRNRLPVPVRTS